MDAIYRDLQGIVSQDAIDSGGLRIYTSLDPDLQRMAEQATDSLLAQVEDKPNYKHPKKSDFSDQSRAAGHHCSDRGARLFRLCRGRAWRDQTVRLFIPGRT